VINLRRVKINGFLDPAQAQGLGKELVIRVGIRRHRGDVVQAFNLVFHDISLHHLSVMEGM
jgi:hypothetical protein